jgi:hypothetical protein
MHVFYINIDDCVVSSLVSTQTRVFHSLNSATNCCKRTIL